MIDIAPSPLMYAMEENLHEHVAYVQRHTPGMFVEDRTDLLVVDSGLATDTFNKIARARLTGDPKPRIEEALDRFRSAGRPFAWWIGPCSRPLDLEHRLQEFGLEAAEFELGMAARIHDVPTHLDLPEELLILPVSTRSQLADFAEVNARNWTPPDAAVVEFFRQASGSLLSGAACPMQLFVGYVGGVPVATGELFLTDQVAGIHMVSTLAECQRRGFGTAMTWKLADEGRRQGASIATLQASEAGQSVYSRLGFVPCGAFVEYR